MRLNLFESNSEQNIYDVSNEPLILNYFKDTFIHEISCNMGLSKFMINETLLEELWNSENWEYYTFEEDGTFTYNDYWT